MGDEEKCNCSDELIAGPETSDGVRPFVRHTSDHRLLGGVMKIAKEGQPVNGAELVHLSQIEGNRYSVTPVYSPPAPSNSGPPKVTSDEYRDGWDRIFGNKTIGQA